MQKPKCSPRNVPAASRPVGSDEAGRIGYVIAWLLGVPVWVLLLIFLVRGH